jgi:hypothetical protein
MVRLPFVVQPRRAPIIERVGSEESGVIEIERRGYLTTGEKTFVQQVQQSDNGSSELITLSRRVARKHALGMDRAYNLVLQIISGKTLSDPDDEAIVNSIEIDFAEDLSAAVRGLASTQFREDLVFAACLIRYRVDPDFNISDIAGIHPDLIAAIAELYRQEESRSLEAFDTTTEDESPAVVASVEEAEKKPGKATKSRSTTTTGG